MTRACGRQEPALCNSSGKLGVAFKLWLAAPDASLTETREAGRNVQGASDHSTSSQKSK